MDLEQKFNVVVYILNWCPTRPCAPFHPEEHGAGGGLTLHTCVCLEALRIQLFFKRSGTSLMRKKSNACMLDIAKVWRHIENHKK